MRCNATPNVSHAPKDMPRDVHSQCGFTIPAQPGDMPKARSFYLAPTYTIAEAKRVYPRNPHAGMTADGYTKRSGAPSSIMVRLTGEKIWRRVMVWQFSNAGTAFVRIKGTPFIVCDSDIPEVQS